MGVGPAARLLAWPALRLRHAREKQAYRGHLAGLKRSLAAGPAAPNYSVKWTAATCHGNLTLTVAAATYLKR